MESLRLNCCANWDQPSCWACVRPWLCVALAVVSPGVAIAQVAAPDTEEVTEIPEGINDRFLDDTLDPQEFVDRFEVESREVFAARKQITEALHLQPTTHVADIGCGTGLYTELFSQAIGSEGRVYAVDISPRLIDYVRDRLAREQLRNVEVIRSTAKDTRLPESSIDVAFICDTYHHFEFCDDMLRSLRFALRPGGQLAVIDFERIPGVSREWVLGHVRGDKQTFREEIERAGFVFVEEVEVEGFHENYFLRFRRP